MREKSKNAQASILDRLIDLEPGASREPVRERFLNFERGRESVIRDLENLLNTKSHAVPVPTAYKEVGNSLHVYGLPDFTSRDPKTLAVRQQLRQEVEKAIALFEPRIRNVTVRVETAASVDERNVWFRISGLLVLDPVAEPVTFDTYFDINKGEYTIPK